MSLIAELVFAAISLTVLVVVARSAAAVYLRFRGTRIITCPETRRPEAVRIDMGHAVATGAFGDRHLRLTTCSRWPVRQDCGQECLAQVEAQPAECLVRTLLVNYYRDKACVYCGKAVTFEHALEHKPAFLAVDGTTIGWSDVPAEQLPQVFATHRPICWNCYVAARFRRQYPELVIDVPDRVAGQVMPRH